MMLSHKPLGQITERDLLQLIEDKAAESKTIEYKRDLVVSTDSEKNEFLYDASSFANTQGGHIVFGMAEASGLPTKIDGLAGIDPDKEIQRLEQILRDGVRPSLAVETKPVRLASGNVALVMRIAKSWNPPHQVTFQKAFRFYARDTNGKYQVDVDELRSIFSLSGTVADRIRNFRADRTSRILTGDAPVKLLDAPILVLHVVPLSAFAAGGSFPFERAARMANDFPTILDSTARNAFVTFDGLLVTSNAKPPPQSQRAYTQVTRNGAVEAVASSLARGRDHNFLLLSQLEGIVIRYAGLYMQPLGALGVSPPIAVLASLLGARGIRVLEEMPPNGALWEDMPCTTLDQDQYHFVESIFAAIPKNDQESADQARGTLHHIANTAGLAASPSFDARGRYIRNIPPQGL